MKSLQIHYYASIVVLASLFCLSFFADAPNMRFDNLSIEMYVIAATLVTIPLALRHFAITIKKAPAATDVDTAFRKYKSTYLLRLYVLNIAALINTALFALSGNSNFMWLSVVLFLTYLFCKPSERELRTMVKTENPSPEE